MISIRGVSKTFARGGHVVRAVDGVSLEVPAGEFLVITGPSGSGKSTLLHLIAGVERPSGGEIRFEGALLTAMSDREVTLLRRRRIGLVFQSANLLPALSVDENVALPLLLDGVPMREARKRATRVLDGLGLAERRQHQPGELSGGEMQRVAIARSLVIDPILILADEPTGSLDSSAGSDVLTWLRSVTEDARRSVVMVTHDPVAASRGDRVVAMRDGRLVSDERVLDSGCGDDRSLRFRTPGPAAA